MLSGRLGPKRCEGDLQIPEGFYRIVQYNPFSNYHLSMKINYPNELDKILACKGSPGGLIYIHGNCVTIGCVPITDDFIKELYIIAVDSESFSGRQPLVYIFPARLTDKNINELKKTINPDEKLINFWHNLKTGYDIFTAAQEELKITIDRSGIYLFSR